MGVLKHFAPWVIFWSGGIETFCFLGYLNILSPKFIKILNYMNSWTLIISNLFTDNTSLFSVFENMLNLITNQIEYDKIAKRHNL